MTREELIEAILQEMVKVNLIGKRAKNFNPWLRNLGSLTKEQFAQAIRQGKRFQI